MVRNILKYLSYPLIAITFFAFGFVIANNLKSETIVLENSTEKPIEKPLEKYTIENLSKVDFPERKINIVDKINKEDSYTSYLFNFNFSPTLDQQIKMTSGQINIPNDGENFPLVIMIRGYVDQTIYTTGVGTKNAAGFFAENGYITVAPDFLGYANSDSEAANIFESRFQTYTTVLSLLKSLYSIEKWDGKNIFIWAHSNGGHIALTTLEITKAYYPTVLWAPVSKPFPYSILYYTDESEDGGKLIRDELAKFEQLYNVDNYSLDNYFDRINSPILLQQGTADDAVPISWSSSLNQKLKSLDKEITYITYPNIDHNMRPAWDAAAEKDLDFFKEHLK